MTHVDDWLEAPSKNAQEVYAKSVLAWARQPAIDKLGAEMKPLFCRYQGAAYRCTGASRLGDVWLTSDPNRTIGYELRVDVDDCSNWSANRPASMRDFEVGK